MTDDHVSAASSREVFEAIVSQLADPEVVRVRRKMLLLGAAVVLGAIVVTITLGLGWQTLLAFSSTFLPGLVVALRIPGRRFARCGEFPHQRDVSRSRHQR